MDIEKIKDSLGKYMKSRIVDFSFSTTSASIDAGVLTICQITLDNGYVVRGEHQCSRNIVVHQSVANNFSYSHAMNKLYPFFMFLLAENKFMGRAEHIDEVV